MLRKINQHYVTLEFYKLNKQQPNITKDCLAENKVTFTGWQ